MKEAAGGGTITIEKLCAQLDGFGLKHSSKGLADMLNKAEDGGYTPRQFLLALLA